MSLQQRGFVRSEIAFALISVLMLCTSALRADDPKVRLADDCVIDLVRIPAGEFEMGRTSRGARLAAALSLGEQGDWATEGPLRKVTLSNPFLIGKYKVTCEQFCLFLNSIDNPQIYVSINHFSRIEKRDGAYRPKKGMESYAVNVVHWDGATAFCDWLSKNSGLIVRLPTEAEWEYVARGTDSRQLPWERKRFLYGERGRSDR